jgi:hypothetical protein
VKCLLATQVLQAMPIAGLPYRPKTAYVVIRAAVNSGRQELAESYAAQMRVGGPVLKALLLIQ